MIEHVIKEPLKEIAASVDRAVKIVTEGKRLNNIRAKKLAEEEEEISRTKPEPN